MSENPLDHVPVAPKQEIAAVITKRLGEGMSTGWEGEQIFTVEEVIAAIRELTNDFPDLGELRATDQLLTHEGVLVSASLRAADKQYGYSYVLKGTHGGTFRPRTIIDRIDYAEKNSEEIIFAEEIAEFKEGTWVK